MKLHLLEVNSLRVLYGKAIAVNGLSLHVDEKEMVGVVGRMALERAPFFGPFQLWCRSLRDFVPGRTY